MSETHDRVLLGKSKKTYSEDEKRELCCQWKASALSLQEFCRRNKLAKSSLYGWSRRYPCVDAADAIKKVNAFSPVMLPITAISRTAEPITIEMVLPNQAQLRLSLQEDRLVSFLQELCHATATIR